ncbi:hypothetical protein CPI31_00050 [Moraxella catarrhalis]|nr:hypothetical protein [Moraxella catarrhalis]
MIVKQFIQNDTTDSQNIFRINPYKKGSYAIINGKFSNMIVKLVSVILSAKLQQGNHINSRNIYGRK